MADFNDSPDIAETLQDGYGFYLEGTIKQHLHGWRQRAKTSQSQTSDLKAAQHYLQKLIDDVEEHGIPSCHM